ncbi:ABC transporter transmembrane domain-containing protein [Hydrogenophaga sp.]|uniref:ABC transporter transmembrane domain-containing protein n=1 Tax=Hydrogenophaga sp. TaxID=1904254 RepID=UPI00271BA801|nr:ABC transporter transmembrane domain-containing protein [Hydrogenophaga sp.]MDO8903012.1 ABC transporter transmembrane domain-containing protein [Hydrogenophaga sp.]
MSLTSASERPKASSATSLSGLLPFMRPYKVQIALAVLFLTLAAVATLLFPVALRHLIDTGLVPEDRNAQAMALQGHFLELFGVAVALGLFSAARFYIVSWLGERITADLRNAVYSHVLRQSPQFFETTQTGEVLSRLTTDTTLVQTVVGSSLSMGLRNAFMGLGALIMLVISHPYVMIQVLLVIGLVVLPTMWFGRRVRKLSRASQDRVADSSAIAAEVLNAIPIVQSYTAEDREARRFDNSTEHAFHTAVRRSRARAGLVAFIIIANAALVLWGLYQGTQAVIAGDLSAGQLGQAVLYTIIFVGAVAVLGEVYGDLLRAAGASERLVELLNTQSPVQSPERPQVAQAPQGGSRVRFDDITFHYPSRPAQAALSEFSLDIPPGQTVALVGPSGAGKSTVFGLLLRYYDPLVGSIRLDGVPIDHLSLHDLRERIGIVPQDPVIFSSSAMENIRYGKPDATDEEVRAAAHAAFADEFIAKLPEGYDTFLGERGVRLSGGQRQRIAIARAMLKNPPLLLLDEATSALDAQSERMVQAALESAMKDRTTLVIAHRLATVQQADLIVVLDHGRLVEQGTHAELVAAGGVYAGLAALQFNV